MDNCYYINLQESKERDLYMKNQLSKNNININRIQAINGLMLKEPVYRELVSALLEIEEKYLRLYLTNLLSSYTNTLIVFSCHSMHLFPNKYISAR